MARWAGLPPPLSHPEALTDAQAEALRFGERVAAAQYFPVLKRGMGMNRACRIAAIRYHAA